MKENSIKERKKELMKRQRHKEKISLDRSTAVSFRWDKTRSSRDSDGSNREGEEGDTEADEAIEPGIELNQGKASARTVRRYEAELKELVPASLQRQCELLKKMAPECDGCKVSIERNVGSRETPKATFARYQATISKFFENAKAKFATLPMILVKSWAQFLIKADASIFTSCGLYFTDKGDVPVSVLAKQESDKIWDSIMKNMRRNDTRNLYITHTIRVVKEVQHWKVHQHGEIIGLARAVGVTEEFAAKVINHVREGKEKELFKRKTWKLCTLLRLAQTYLHLAVQHAALPCVIRTHWKKDCAVGACTSCPDLLVYVDERIDASADLEFIQWRKDVSARTTKKGEKKEVFALFKVTMKIEDAVEYLQELTPALKLHIYTAYNQWRAKKLAEESLKVDTILIVDDYQMNLTVELAETTTSTVFGSNNILIAIFPVVVMFRREETDPVEKATITFFSDDISHDHQ
jgi:hypothetical protein